MPHLSRLVVFLGHRYIMFHNSLFMPVNEDLIIWIHRVSLIVETPQAGWSGNGGSAPGALVKACMADRIGLRITNDMNTSAFSPGVIARAAFTRCRRALNGRYCI